MHHLSNHQLRVRLRYGLETSFKTRRKSFSTGLREDANVLFCNGRVLNEWKSTGTRRLFVFLTNGEKKRRSAFTTAECELFKVPVSVFVISVPLSCSKGQAYDLLTNLELLLFNLMGLGKQKNTKKPLSV